jgi:hypothetical protein
MKVVTCEIVVNDTNALDVWGTQDDPSPLAYTNTAEYTADVDTTGTCGEPPELPETNCSATWTRPVPQDCLPNPCVPLVTKVNTTVWNENEFKLTGMHRCLVFWDQTPLALYAELGVPNNFLFSSLQTAKGKARLDGIESQVCDVDFDPADGPIPSHPRDIESVAAPLLGVATSGWTSTVSRPPWRVCRWWPWERSPVICNTI